MFDAGHSCLIGLRCPGFTRISNPFQFSSQQVAIAGFSLGACISLASAVKHPDLLAACIPCYGVPPNKEAYPTHKISIPVQGHYAKKDRWVNAVPKVRTWIDFECV